MRTRVPLLVGAILLAGLAMAGAATATQADGQYHSFDESINGTDGDGNETGVGICVVGADSPCNGEQWDDDNETSDDDRQLGDDEQSDEGDAGICMVGAGGPCNGDQADGDGQLTPAEEENRTGDRIEPNKDDGGEAGICLVGADSACNGNSAPNLSVESVTAQRQSTFDFFVGLFGALF